MSKINEKTLNDYPKPVFIEGTEIILNQMKKKICKVSTESGSKGTCFFCKNLILIMSLKSLLQIIM